MEDDDDDDDDQVPKRSSGVSLRGKVSSKLLVNRDGASRELRVVYRGYAFHGLTFGLHITESRTEDYKVFFLTGIIYEVLNFSFLSFLSYCNSIETFNSPPHTPRLNRVFNTLQKKKKTNN